MTRRCPLCHVITPEALCPRDGTATLAPMSRGIDGRALPAGFIIAGRYRVERAIGAGAFGAVYSATHQLTRQAVAIKVLAEVEGEEGDRSALRFFHEARVTARLSHPNTVRVFDFGQDDRGPIYLVMELLQGHTLRRVMQERGGRFTEAEAIDIGVAVTRSIGEAHALGLVHRDLKPENLMFHEVTGDRPQLKVLDFGIAKQSEVPLTAAGEVPCTPAYASPEQVLATPLDARSDLYSLGVILFELLAGAVPFRGPSALATLYMQVHAAVPDLREVAAAPVSPGLVAVVTRALAKAPEERFADAAQMRAALEAARSGAEAPRWEGGGDGEPTLPVTAAETEVLETRRFAPLAEPSQRASGPRVRAWVGGLAVAAVTLAVLGVALEAPEEEGAPVVRSVGDATAAPTPTMATPVARAWAPAAATATAGVRAPAPVIESLNLKPTAKPQPKPAKLRPPSSVLDVEL